MGYFFMSLSPFLFLFLAIPFLCCCVCIFCVHVFFLSLVIRVFSPNHSCPFTCDLAHSFFVLSIALLLPCVIFSRHTHTHFSFFTTYFVSHTCTRHHPPYPFLTPLLLLSYLLKPLQSALRLFLPDSPSRTLSLPDPPSLTLSLSDSPSLTLSLPDSPSLTLSLPIPASFPLSVSRIQLCPFLSLSRIHTPSIFSHLLPPLPSIFPLLPPPPSLFPPHRSDSLLPRAPFSSSATLIPSATPSSFSRLRPSSASPRTSPASPPGVRAWAGSCVRAGAE